MEQAEARVNIGQVDDIMEMRKQWVFSGVSHKENESHSSFGLLGLGSQPGFERKNKTTCFKRFCEELS